MSDNKLNQSLSDLALSNANLYQVLYQTGRKDSMRTLIRGICGGCLISAASAFIGGASVAGLALPMVFGSAVGGLGAMVKIQSSQQSEYLEYYHRVI